MYRAFNDYVVVKSDFNDNLEEQMLLGEVVSTTSKTKGLQGLTIAVTRHKMVELGETDEEPITEGGILLGSKSKYAAVHMDNILAVYENGEKEDK